VANASGLSYSLENGASITAESESMWADFVKVWRLDSAQRYANEYYVPIEKPQSQEPQGQRVEALRLIEGSHPRQNCEQPLLFCHRHRTAL
jgi:hypothetical protein